MKTLSSHRALRPQTVPQRGRLVSSYDPALPQDGALIIAGVLRSQFAGLAAMIEAVPAGPPGPQGVPGAQGGQGIQGVPGVQGIQGETGATGAPGPAGAVGSQGPQGEPGAQGPTGDTGPQGPPFSQAVVDGVETLPPSYPATVQTSFDGANVHFTFGIPQGYEGQPGQRGPQGEQGPQGIEGGAGPQGYAGPEGPQGPQGPPGEVTQSQLDSAIAGTARNPSSVSPLNIAVSDPPTQAEVQAVVNKVNEMLAALGRAGTGIRGKVKRDKGDQTKD